MIDHLLTALEREAAQQVAALRAAAEEEAARITHDADTRLAGRKRDALSAKEAELRGAAEAAVGAARRRARRGVLEARERFLTRVFDAARAMFPAALASDAFAAALPRLVTEALHPLSGEPTVIRCPATLGDAVRQATRGRERLAIECSPDAPPGITAATTDGAILVDNTLQGRLDRLRPQLTVDVLARMATDGGT